MQIRAYLHINKKGSVRKCPLANQDSEAESSMKVIEASG